MPAGHSSPREGSIARVLVDSPLPQLDRLFDYRVPPELATQVRLGIRVRVPWRSAGRFVDAYVIDLVDSVEFTGVLSSVEAVVSLAPVLAPEVATLARKAADRAAGSAIDIVRVAVPGRQARVEKAWLAADETAALPPVVGREVSGYSPGRIEDAVLTGGRLAVDAIPLGVEVAPSQWVGRWAIDPRGGGHRRPLGRKVGDPRRARLSRPGTARGSPGRSPAPRAHRAARCPPVQSRSVPRLPAVP